MEEKGYYTLRDLIENEELRKKYLTPPVIEKTLGNAVHIPTEHLKKIAENTNQNWTQRHPFIMLLIGAILGLLSAYIIEILKGNHILGL